VFVQVSDPVKLGFIASLAQPGGNITGFTIFEHSFAGKWLEMLKEAAPVISRVAVMQNPDHPAWEGYLRAISTVASPLGVEVTPAPVHNAAEIERSDATEPNLPFHWDIDPARVMRPRFADSIRASSTSGLREQAGHMTASDFCAARYIFSCQAGAIHT
jgi:hypothetical protein